MFLIFLMRTTPIRFFLWNSFIRKKKKINFLWKFIIACGIKNLLIFNEYVCASHGTNLLKFQFPHWFNKCFSCEIIHFLLLNNFGNVWEPHEYKYLIYGAYLALVKGKPPTHPTCGSNKHSWHQNIFLFSCLLTNE